jgi:hypothetical protein
MQIKKRMPEHPLYLLIVVVVVVTGSEVSTSGSPPNDVNMLMIADNNDVLPAITQLTPPIVAVVPIVATATWQAVLIALISAAFNQLIQ